VDVEKEQEKKQENRVDEEINKEKKKKKRRKIVVDQGNKEKDEEIQALSTLGSPFIQIVNGEIIFPTIPTPPPTTPTLPREISVPRGARCLGKSNKFVGQSGRFVYDPEKDKKKSKGKAK